MTHIERRPDVKGNLLLHYDVQKPSLLLVLDSAARGLNFLLQLAAPLPSICKMKTWTHMLLKENKNQTWNMKNEKINSEDKRYHTIYHATFKISSISAKST